MKATTMQTIITTHSVFTLTIIADTISRGSITVRDRKKSNNHRSSWNARGEAASFNTFAQSIRKTAAALFRRRRNLYFHRDANTRIIESKHVGFETRLDAQYSVNLSLLISSHGRVGGTHVSPLIQRIIGPSKWAADIKRYFLFVCDRVVNYVFTVMWRN